MQIAAQILLVVIAGGIIWALLRPQYEFVLRIRNAEVQVLRGKVSSAFLREFGELCARENLSSGTIRGVKKGPHTALAFSREIPTPNQQQIRNIWGVN